jgi:hypothetical protein
MQPRERRTAKEKSTTSSQGILWEDFFFKFTSSDHDRAKAVRRRYNNGHYKIGTFFWYSGGVESNWVHSALQPLISLLRQPRVIMMR